MPYTFENFYGRGGVVILKQYLVYWSFLNAIVTAFVLNYLDNKKYKK
jgi:hypothetical protein